MSSSSVTVKDETPRHLTCLNQLMDTKSLPPYEINGENASVKQASQPSLPHVRDFRHLLAALLKCHQREQQNFRPVSPNSNGNIINLDHEPSSRPGSSYLDLNFDHKSSNSAVSNQSKDEDYSLAILSVGPLIQPIQIEPRAQDVSSFNVNADLLCTFGDGRNRWLNYNKKPDAPPQPLRLPRFIMSPSLCSLWLSKLSPSQPSYGTLSPSPSNFSRPNPAKSLTGLDLTHLIIITGQAATETRKFIATDSLHEAASTLFNELANGYSIVFVGTMLKSEFEARMVKGRAYQICKGVDEILFWANSSGKEEGAKLKKANKDRDVTLTDEGKRSLGIIC